MLRLSQQLLAITLIATILASFVFLSFIRAEAGDADVTRDRNLQQSILQLGNADVIRDRNGEFFALERNNADVIRNRNIESCELADGSPGKPDQPNPADGFLDAPTSVTLSVHVSDPDRDPMDVSFYDATAQSLIGTAMNVPSGGTASVHWTTLGYLKTYSWYAIADDSKGGATQSDTWSFTTDGSGRETKIAVIFAKFSDNDPIPTHKAQHYLVGSDPFVSKLRRYYADISYGTINIKLDFFNESDGTWKYTVGHDRLYYGSGVGNDRSDPNNREVNFTQDCVNAADADINYESYDIVLCIHTGNDEALKPSGVQNDMWSQYFEESATSLDGDQVRNRIVLAEEDPMGTWAHEIGHAMGKILKGTPLYDLYGENGQVGEWDLMGNGSLRTFQTGTRPSQMSGYSKMKLGWVTSQIIGYNTYELESIETLSAGDFQNVLTFYPGGLPFQPGLVYYVVECRTDFSSFGQWQNEWRAPDSGIVLYEVTTRPFSLDIVNKITLSGQDYLRSTLKSSGDYYLDPFALVNFSFVQREARDDGYYSTVSINPWTPLDLLGAKLSQTLSQISLPLAPSSMDLTPDLDLHAYTSDGRHIGMNYASGIYENQISGALASGDLIGADEWILVPEGTEVTFSVSTHDVDAFLEAYPEYQSQFDEMPFNVTYVGFDKNGTRHDMKLEALSITPNSTVQLDMRGSIIPGDVSWNGEVDMQDISILIDNFMATPPNWNPNCDVNNDFTIDMADISIAIDHFMQS